MKNSRYRTAVAAATCLGVTVLLTACGGTAEPDGDKDRAGVEDDGDSAAPGDGDGDAEQVDPAEMELAPLDEFMNQIYGGWDEETANKQQMEVEELTAECMLEQGFAYTPVDWSAMGGGMSYEEPDIAWGTLEFAEQYGYGATTNPYGDEEPMPEETMDEWVDPNQEYLESMSEAEMMAYQEALWGTMSTEEFDPDAEVEYSWENAGCQGWAQHEVQGDFGMTDDTFSALEEEMNSLWESQMSDPRLAEVSAEWASCMADAGHPGLAAVEDAANSIYDKTNVIYEEAYADMDPNVEWTPELDAQIQEGVEAALAELTTEEIELAVADFTCQEEVRYLEVQQEVSFALQQDFVDAHRAELEAWAAAAEASRQ